MKSIIYLILTALSLQSAELTLNRYEDGNQSVDIYHLKDLSPITCTKEYGKKFAEMIRCKLAQPLTKERATRHDPYFDIQFKGDEVLFIAKAYMKILPVDDKLILKNRIVVPQKEYRHWAIIGAQHEPKILKDGSTMVLNYPVEYQQKDAPYVGPLDLNGEPIKDKKGARLLTQVKELFSKGKYHDLILLSDAYQKKHSDPFAKELSFYKIRALDRLAQEDNTIYPEIEDEALNWISENPSNAHIPEAYMYVAKSFYKRGRLTEGNKYRKILETGFKENKYTQLAKIAFAEAIYNDVKRRHEALKIYKDILYTTKDVPTASIAAMHITKAYLDMKMPSKAQKIFEKVLKSSQEYMRTHPNEVYRVSRRLAEYQKYDVAIKGAQYLLLLENASLDKDSILKDLGYWYEKKGDKANAIAIYEEYLKTFPKGAHRAFVKEHLDLLLIDTQEQNLTKKLNYLDNLINQYLGSDLAKRALEKKVQLLQQLGRDKEVVGMRTLLQKEGMESYVKESAKKLLLHSLEKKECLEVIKLQEDYNLTLATHIHDEALYTCYMQSARYKKALDLAALHIESKDLEEKLRWLYFSVKAYRKVGKNLKVIASAKDVLKLAKITKQSHYLDVLYDMFYAYYDLKEYNNMLLTAQKLEKLFPKDIRNIDAFIKVVRYGQKSKNSLLVVNYAKKVILLQKYHKTKTYSPKIEIAYVHALKKIGKYKQALQEDLKLLTTPLSDAQKAEVLYLAGDISTILGEKANAKEFFLKCAEVVKNSEWQKLCVENLSLLEE